MSYDAADYTEAHRFGVPVWMISSRLMSGRAFEMPCSALVQRLTTKLFDPPLPRLMTCVISAEHLNRVRYRFPDTLSSAAPDFEFAYKFIHAFERESLVFLDEAIFLSHSKCQSTSNFSEGHTSGAAADFMRLNSASNFPFSPLPERLTPYNVVAHEVNKLMAEMGRAPLIDAANLLSQEERWASQAPRGLRRRLNTIRAIMGLTNDINVQVGVGKLLPDFDFARLRYRAAASTLFDHPDVRPFPDWVPGAAATRSEFAQPPALESR